MATYTEEMKINERARRIRDTDDGPRAHTLSSLTHGLPDVRGILLISCVCVSYDIFDCVVQGDFVFFACTKLTFLKISSIILTIL